MKITRHVVVSLLFTAISATALTTFSPSPAHALVNMALPGGGGDYYLKTHRTMYDNKFSRVLKQKYDFSCGSAALASMLYFHYKRPVNEQEVMKAMFAIGDQEKIRKEGFSLLDMKNYLQSIGLHADGYKESLDKLMRVGIPAIALINHNGYKHFVVIQAVSEDKVLIGDPALGMKLRDRKQFEAQWNGILFVVNDDMDTARSTLAGYERWRVFPRARFDNQLIENELSSFILHTQPTPGYY